MIATDGRMAVTRPRLVRPAVMAASALMVVAGCSSGPEQGLLTAVRNADGTQRWTADRFGDAQLQVAAAADTVIVGVNDPGSEPSDAPRVIAIDSTTGQTRWVIPLDGLGQILDVAVASDLAVVRASGTSMDNAGQTVILGVSLSNGHIWWRHELGISEVSKPLLVSGDTVVVDMLIYLWAGQTATGTIEELGPSAAVVVLDADTGELRWRIDREFDLDDPGDQNVVESFSLSEDEVVGRIGSELAVWNARTGDEVWTSRAHGGGGGPGGGAWIAGERVVAASREQVGADASRLDASVLSSGNEQWSRQMAADVAVVAVAAVAAATTAASFVATWGGGNSCD